MRTTGQDINGEAIRFLLLAAVGLWVLAGWGGGAVAVRAETVARVDGTDISRSQLHETVSRLERQRADRGLPAQDVPEADLETAALEILIGRTLLAHKARELGLRVEEREVDAYMEGLRAPYDDETAYQSALEGMQLTEAEIRWRFQQDALIGKLMDSQVGAKATVADDEVASFYETHMAYFVKPGQVRAAHILVRVPPQAGPAQRERARKKIDALHRRLLRGEDFAVLAIEYSEGPSNVRGGDLGFFVRAQVEKPLADAAFSLRVGEISDVVESRLGYHIVRVLDRRPPEAIALDSVREPLGRRLRLEKIDRGIDAYLEALRREARIEISGSAAALP